MPSMHGTGDARVVMGVIRAGTATPEIVSHPAPIEPVRPRMAIELTNPVQDRLRDFIIENRKTDPLLVCEQNIYAGQTLALCGAGPSLRDETIRGADQVWACNSGLTYLLENGVHVDAAIGIDQTPGLLKEWRDAPDVPYYVATSCDPYLVQHLSAKGREVRFFHSWVGVNGEREMYDHDWPYMPLCGEGASVVSRTIGLAHWMGFERVDVYGADCAFADGDIAHANGETAEQAYRPDVLMEGTIGNRTWRTRPDMLLDAVHLARRVRQSSGRIRLIGDTLPVSLMSKSDGFLDLVCRRLAPGEVPPAA